MGKARLLALVAVLGLVLAACGDDATPGPGDDFDPAALPVRSIGECQTVPDRTIEPAEPLGVNFNAQLAQAGKLTIGSDTTYPPFEFIDEETGELQGFDVSLGNEIARRLQLEPEWISADFGALVSTTIPQGRFDVGISAITIRQDRQEGVNFSIPYFKADLSLAVREDSGITTIDDLEGQMIGAEVDTTGEDCARVIAQQVGATDVTTFNDSLQAFDDLAAGRVAGVINDLPSAAALIVQRSGLTIVQRIETQEVYGIAIGKQKPDLRVAINDALRAMFDDGTFAGIYAEWFNVEPPFPLPPMDLPG